MERLSDAAALPLTLIVAMAGYGKSVALAQFLEYSGATYVRYTVRDDNRSLFGFVRGLAQALQPVIPGALNALPELEPEPHMNGVEHRFLASWLLRQLAGYCGIIAIDDYHLAQGDSRVQQFVRLLIEGTPERVRWIIATREVPDLPIASWMVYGRTAGVIDSNELLFTLGEVRHVVHEAGLDLGHDQLERLHAFSGGWAITLSFAIYTANLLGTFDGVEMGSREMVYRYLAEQVFGGLSDRQREFILDACVFPFVDVRVMIEAGYDDAAELADALQHRAAFIERETETRFRFHELFRQFLESKLAARGSREQKNLSEQAGNVLERCNLKFDALGCYMRASSHANVLRLIETEGFRFLDEGKRDVVKSALTSLPASVRSENGIVMAINGALEAAIGRFNRTDALFRKAVTAISSAEMRAEVAVHYAYIAMLRNPAQAISLLKKHAEKEDLPLSLRVRALSYLGIALAIREGFPEAQAASARAVAEAPAVNDDYVEACAFYSAAFVAMRCNDPMRAKGFAIIARDFAERTSSLRLRLKIYSTLQGICARFEDDRDAALEYQEKMAQIAEKLDLPQLAAMVFENMYLLQASSGNERALEEIDARLAELNTVPAPKRPEVCMANALRIAWSGNYSGAYELMLSVCELADSQMLKAACWAETAVFASATGKRREAEMALEQSRKYLSVAAARKPHAEVDAPKAMTLSAITYLLLGKPALARRTLARVEAKYGSMSLQSLFCNTVQVIYFALEGGRSDDDVAEALAKLRKTAYGGYALLLERLPFPEPSKQTSLAALTAAELEILRALARGETSRSIAERSERSLETIQKHIKTVCRKLGCQGRVKAILFAKDHGLV